MALSMTRYNPTARASSAATVSPGRRTAGQYPGGGNNHQYDNHDGPVRPGGDPRGDTIDYGPSNGPSQQERIDAAWKKWGGSGLYVNGVEMPWAHGPDQERGMRAPFFTPDVLDPRNAGYFAGGTSPEQEAARMNARNSRYADTYSGNMQDSSFASSADTLRQFGIDVSDPNVRLGELAYKNKNNPALVAAINEHGRQMEIAKRGLSQDYRPPSRSGGPWPAPHAPQSQGGGAPPATVQGGVRRGATPQANAPMSAGAPPSANPMFQGYQSGGAGVSSGGSGNWGPAGGQRQIVDTAYRPGRDGPAINNGWWNQGGAMRPPGDNSYVYYPGSDGGGNPFASMGGGETGMMYPGGGMSGGVSPQLINMLMQMRGGGMGAMPMGGNMGMMGGGYNPYASFGMY